MNSTSGSPEPKRNGRVTSMLRVIAVNALLLMAGVGLILVMPSVIFGSYHYLQTSSDVSPNTPKPSLANYAGVEWAEQHFIEISALKTDYFDYFVWRRRAFSGETIRIDGEGLRATTPTADPSRGRLWAMGGSAMWGHGGRDEDTIASFMARSSDYSVENLGESGYRARQSLNFLLHRLTSHEHPDVYVSYDGYNEAFMGCRQQNRADGTDREKQIRQALESGTKDDDALQFRYVLEPPLALLRLVLDRSPSIGALPAPDLLVCDTDPARAQQVARALISDWLTMQALADSQGARFLPVLQPALALSRSRHDDVEVKEDIKRQLEAVYPLIREEARLHGLEFLDLTEALAGTENVFIDQVHVSPRGNEIIAGRIGEYLTSD